MRKIILLIAYLLYSFIGTSQQLVAMDKYYYKSSDTCNIASRVLIGSSNIDWRVKLSKIKVHTIANDSVGYSIRYSVVIGDEEKLFDIDCFVVDSNTNCIISSLLPKIKRGKFALDIFIHKDQQIMFCLDGGRIYTLQ